MTSSNEGSPIQVHTSKPPGVLPKHLQAWVMGSLALAMVMVIAFSSRTPTKAPKPPPPPDMTSAAPSPPRIDEYKALLDRETQRLRETQAKLEAERAAFDPLLQKTSPLASGIPAVSRVYLEEKEDWIALDLEKRQYQSRFTSNISTSRRRPSDATHAPDSPAANMSARSSQQPMSAEAKVHQAGGPGYRIPEGTVIEATLVNRLDSTFSGPVDAQVTTNVHSEDHRKLLIPKGSRVLGTATRVDALNQQRLAVTFHRIQLPNGTSISLQDVPGLSQAGETGLLDKVNHHYGQIFGVSIAIGAIAGLSQVGTNYGADASATDVYRQGVSSSLSQSALHVLDKYTNIAPTFTIREGTRVKVWLTEDLEVPAYLDGTDQPTSGRIP